MSKPTMASPAPAAPSAYNPLSKLAIIGLGCSVLYAVIVVVNVLSSFMTGVPPLLGDWLWAFPLAGAGLSLLGFRQIRNSEGTLSGEPLTLWGLGLSVVTGLGYGAYFLVTGLAIQQQANHFLTVPGEESGFFQYLQDGDVNRAFLLTLPPTKRKNISADDPKKMAVFEMPRGDPRDPRGLLTQFTENYMIQLLIASGQSKKPIQPLGVKLWKYDKGEYVVERNYRIETDELTLDILVPVHSFDAPGEARQWYVDWGSIQITTNAKLTPLGEKIQVMRYQAGSAFQGWLDSVNKGKIEAPFPDDRTDWNSASFKAAGQALLKKIRQEMEDVLKGKDKNAHTIKTSQQQQQYISWKEIDGHPEFYFTMFLLVPFQPGANELQQVATFEVAMRSDEKMNAVDEGKTPTWKAASYRLLSLREAPGAKKSK